MNRCCFNLIFFFFFFSSFILYVLYGKHHVVTVLCTISPVTFSWKDTQKIYHTYLRIHTYSIYSIHTDRIGFLDGGGSFTTFIFFFLCCCYAPIMGIMRQARQFSVHFTISFIFLLYTSQM